MFCGIRKASSKYAFFTYFFKFQQKKKAESAGTFSFFRDEVPIFSQSQNPERRTSSVKMTCKLFVHGISF